MQANHEIRVAQENLTLLQRQAGAISLTGNLAAGGLSSSNGLSVTNTGTMGAASITGNVAAGGLSSSNGLSVTNTGTLGAAIVTNLLTAGNFTTAGYLGVTGSGTIGSLTVSNVATFSGGVSAGAGTGKTYTAVALAVRALKNKEVKRIILTRPAVEAGNRCRQRVGD